MSGEEGVEGRLEFSRKFIRFGSATLPRECNIYPLLRHTWRMQLTPNLLGRIFGRKLWLFCELCKVLRREL